MTRAMGAAAGVGGTLPPAFRYDGVALRPLDRPAPDEAPLAIVLGDRPWVTILCTPTDLRALVLGFLYFAEAIDGPNDVCLRLREDTLTAEIILRQPERAADLLGRRRMLTAGAVGSNAFDRVAAATPHADGPRLTPDELTTAMTTLNRLADKYRASGGMHGSLLWSDGAAIAVAEDISRHNTIDKIAGHLLLHGHLGRAHQGLLVTTGRISAENLLKAARLHVPVVASHTSPTALAIALADRLGITVAGYVRGGHCNIYTHPWRLAIPTGEPPQETNQP